MAVTTRCACPHCDTEIIENWLPQQAASLPTFDGEQAACPHCGAPIVRRVEPRDRGWAIWWEAGAWC